MNFFYGIKNNILNSSITIPRFQNKEHTNTDILLYQALIENNKWNINIVDCESNNDFYFIDNSLANNEKIFFLARKEEIKLLEKINYSKLLKLNNFTDTVPAFRSNLKIYINNGGFSSYQSEYPFLMVQKFGSILTPVSTLLNKQADINIVFIKNIFEEPIKKKFKAYFINIVSKEILYEKDIYTNLTNEIEVSKDLINSDIFLFTDKFLGVPMYVSIKDSNISFEHTHPPHEYILSNDKFKKVSELKKDINEIIN